VVKLARVVHARSFEIPMKRFVWITLLGLLLPCSVFADSSSQVDFSNSGGTLTGWNGGMSLAGATLTSVVNYNGLGTITGNDLGTMGFDTGPLISGSLETGAVFAGGGKFVIATNGSQGLPDGVIFTGSFSGDVLWQMQLLSSGGRQFTLTGPISGTLIEGNSNIAVTGLTVQLTVTVGKNGAAQWRSILVASGVTNLTPVPEPGTLGLLGTGLVAMAAFVRYRLKARSAAQRFQPDQPSLSALNRAG
jgi:hypothetical protein